VERARADRTYGKAGLTTAEPRLGRVRVSGADGDGEAQDPRTHSARLYGIKNTNGQLTDEEVCERDEDDRRRAYHPVPANYEALIPISLKRTMEFSGFALNDRLSKMRQEYFAMGGLPSNTRYGWLRRG
jgi:hypothetical protein